MQFKTPTTKKENYELYHKGVYGNRLRSWETFDSLHDDVLQKKWPVEKPVALRTSSTPGIQLPNYCSRTAVCDVTSLASIWHLDYGIPLDQIHINEIGPDDKIALQGEVMRSTNYLSLRYSEVKLMMRQALQLEERHSDGFEAYSLLKTYMDDSSFENLQNLFDKFPDAIIEFSCYSESLGDLGWNTVFWEVRNY